jgi:hypothetical protein
MNVFEHEARRAAALLTIRKQGGATPDEHVVRPRAPCRHVGYHGQPSAASGYHEWFGGASSTRAGHRCLYLMAREAGRVVGVLPLAHRQRLFGRTITSLPFVNYGGPLASCRGSPALVQQRRVGDRSSAGT